MLTRSPLGMRRISRTAHDTGGPSGHRGFTGDTGDEEQHD